MPQHSQQLESIPGHILIVVALLLFIIIAGIRRMTAAVSWDALSASITAPAGALQHWPDGRLDINRASEAELCLLPGVGPARARAIIEERDRSGGFSTTLDLDRVYGIGIKTIDWFDEAIVLHPAE